MFLHLCLLCFGLANTNDWSGMKKSLGSINISIYLYVQEDIESESMAQRQELLVRRSTNECVIH